MCFASRTKDVSRRLYSSFKVLDFESSGSGLEIWCMVKG